MIIIVVVVVVCDNFVVQIKDGSVVFVTAMKSRRRLAHCRYFVDALPTFEGAVAHFDVVVNSGEEHHREKAVENLDWGASARKKETL